MSGSNHSLLARALANRSRNTLGAQMPQAPMQGPQPNFLEAQMPGTPQQGPVPNFGPPAGQSPAAPPPTPMMAAAAHPQGPPPLTHDQALQAALNQAQGLPPMPPSQQVGPMPQAAPGSMAGQNELERDYYRQLAANPDGFDKGWLGRVFG